MLHLNVTGLPSDPIAARRTAQTIQKELNKLKSDGRSGVIRWPVLINNQQQWEN